MTTTNDQNDPKTLEALISRMRETLGFAESLLEPKDDESSEPTFDQRGDPKLASEMTTTRMLVYWIGCAGLQTAAQRLGPGQRIDRIGCTTERDLADRLSATSADAYGSWARDATGVLASEPGFERWIMQRIGATRGALDPAVMVRTRSIEIQLPAGMTRRWFDRALHTALSPWCLATRIPGCNPIYPVFGRCRTDVESARTLRRSGSALRRGPASCPRREDPEELPRESGPISSGRAQRSRPEILCDDGAGDRRTGARNEVARPGACCPIAIAGRKNAVTDTDDESRSAARHARETETAAPTQHGLKLPRLCASSVVKRGAELG